MTTRLTINRGYSQSLGNLIDLICKPKENKDNAWIEVEEKEPNIFVVISNGITRPETTLGFSNWDEEAIDLDNGSDESQCFGMSNRLQWNEVILTPDEMSAPTVDRLKAALEHITFCSWDPDDI